ncbi:alpha-D-ribose 1-methylphosphonate 5-triphosphate diphosphatase [Paracoccus sp. S-4012]|uniref:alpha-D-ribose 1-methylphosphonate 5-triphosphate diphosphatase n=1 Tax=Paracoccus sp. S-4012 TaxID=2665648 RepID=UPI0012AF2363|nr:alpha-D-ribose 1-methylphosphonate 5-triphosphate diphosphatase [Paracoccus sp. S-4012]MRX50726.1 alpha-D-ribose 1-methylphosphonate 5-triphosphate diphosphatase [Paracoccus sp. S-4012]
MSETVLANAMLVLPGEVVRGSLRIAEGRIAEVQPGAGVPKGAEDCGGDFLAPGLIELHTDNLERHIRPRPRVDWPHANAILAHDAELAGAGITTVFDALRVGSLESRADEFPRYARPLASEIMALRTAGALKISHRIHLRAEICSETLAEELDEFGPEDRIGIVSVMDHTPGQRQFRDIAQLARYFPGGADDPGFAPHIAAMQALRARVGAAHEAAVIAAGRRLGAALASHDDTTPEQVAESAARGIRLAEFPATVEAAQACRARGIAVMMGAPNLIRGGSHSGNVAASDLAAADLLDILSSDYIPASLLAGALALADLWDDLPRAIATVTAAPAAATGLADRGVLREGLRADLVRFGRLGTAPLLRGTWVEGQRVA